MKEKNERPTREGNSAESPLVKASWDSLKLNDGCPNRIQENADNKAVIDSIVVPLDKTDEATGEFHNGSSGGHLRVKKG